MKKLLLLTALVCITALSSKAQYHPMLDSSNYWHYTANYMPVKLQASTLCNYPQWFDMGKGQYTTTDTVINNLTYKKMVAAGQSSPSACDFGYLREDTAAQKIYFIDNTGAPEILLYDFSMQVNDSINITFINNWGYLQSGYYKLDSIRTRNISAGPRREFFLSCHSCSNSHKLSWIESVGSPMDVVYPYSTNMYSSGFFAQCQGDLYQTSQILTCFEHNSSKVYSDSCALSIASNNPCILFTDSCHYGNVCGSVDDNTLMPIISVQPNPASDHVTITMELAHGSEAEILLYDIYGRRINVDAKRSQLPAGRTDQRIMLPSLTSGVYLLECRTTTGSAFQKIIVQQ